MKSADSVIDVANVAVASRGSRLIISPAEKGAKHIEQSSGIMETVVEGHNNDNGGVDMQ